MLVRMLMVLTPMLLAGFWQRPLLLPTVPLTTATPPPPTFFLSFFLCLFLFNIRCGEISKIDLIKGIRTRDPEILALLGHGINYGHGSEAGAAGNPNPPTTTANANANAAASASASTSANTGATARANPDVYADTSSTPNQEPTRDVSSLSVYGRGGIAPPHGFLSRCGYVRERIFNNTQQQRNAHLAKNTGTRSYQTSIACRGGHGSISGAWHNAPAWIFVLGRAAAASARMFPRRL